jgi:hypothetical protein
MKTLIIGTSQTWAYIFGELDYVKRYRVHVINPITHLPLCNVHGSRMDEYDETDKDSFIDWEWSCKRCIKIIEKITQV